MPRNKRSTLELERLRLERKRKKMADKEYARKKWPACPQCGHHHDPNRLRHPLAEASNVIATPVTSSASESEGNNSTVSDTESTNSPTSEDSNSTPTENPETLPEDE